MTWPASVGSWHPSCSSMDFTTACIIQVPCKTEKTYGAKMASNSSELNSTNNFEYDSVLLSEIEIRAAIENVMNEGET